VSPQDARRAIRGLYAVTPDTDDTPALVREVAAAIAGGATLVQYRNKIAARDLRLEQASALKSLCRERGALLIVNDSIDVARAVDADGVHLGRDDGPAAPARAALGLDKIVGISCYRSLETAQAALAAGADYVAFGSFFPSSVKPGAVRAPLELLTQARQTLAAPIVAIGGITAENGGALVRAGADALAVISAVFAMEDVEAAARAFAPLFEAPR
jgi:thiamine-phosphate pyrophosphorylase